MVRLPLLFTLLSLFITVHAFTQDEPVTEQQLQAESSYIRANQLKLMGKWEEALKIFEDLARKDKRNHAALYEAARIYVSQEQWENAERSIRGAIRLDPSQPWYHIILVDIFEAQGKFSDAADVFKDLVPLRPDQQALYERWSYLLEKSGKWEDAVQVIEEEEKVFGKSLDLTAAKVDILKKNDQPERVFAAWKELHRTFPARTLYLKYLVDDMVEFGRKEGLREIYEKILQIDPDDAETRIKLSKLDMLDDSPSRQLDRLKPIIQDPDVPLDQKILALIPFVEKLASAKDTALGNVLLEQAASITRQYPARAKAFALYGDILNQMDKLEEAANAYERTLELDDTNPVVWQQYLYSLDETGQYERLIPAAERAMDLFPNKAENYLLYGNALMTSGKWSDVLDVTDQALLMSGKNEYIRSRAFQQLARCRHMMEDIPRRDENLVKAMSMQANLLESMRLKLGWDLLEGKTDNEWSEQLKGALASFPGDASLRLFELFKNKGDAWEGTVTAGDLPADIIADGYAQEWIGSLLEAKGFDEAAADWMKRASEKPQHHPETIFKLDRIMGRLEKQ